MDWDFNKNAIFFWFKILFLWWNFPHSNVDLKENINEASCFFIGFVCILNKGLFFILTFVFTVYIFIQQNILRDMMKDLWIWSKMKVVAGNFKNYILVIKWMSCTYCKSVSKWAKQINVIILDFWKVCLHVSVYMFASLFLNYYRQYVYLYIPVLK